MGNKFSQETVGEVVTTCMQGDLERIREIFNQQMVASANDNPKSVKNVQPLLEATDAQENHALGGACCSGKLELVEYLLGFDNCKNVIEKKNDMGVSPLWIAAGYGHLSVVKLLLANKANVHSANYKGDSVLVAATFKGHSDIVGYLLNCGARVGQRNDGYDNAMSIAISNDNVVITSLLLQAINEDKDTKWHVSTEDKQGVKEVEDSNKEQENSTAVASIDKEGASVDNVVDVDEILMLDAMFTVNPTYLRTVISNKNKINLFPLILAAMNDNAQIIHLLILHGVDVNQTESNGVTAFAMACYYGHVRAVKEFLRWTPQGDMHLGLKDKKERSDKKYQYPVIDVDKPDNNGNTALWLASSNGHTEVVKALVDFFGDDAQYKNGSNNEKVSVLEVAKRNDHVECHELLKTIFIQD